jgi:hypothetical protein
MNDELTPEQIAKHYAAAMDSVNLINAGKPDYMEDAEWGDTLTRNKEHLQLILERDYWTTEDLQPFRDAIAKVEAL